MQSSYGDEYYGYGIWMKKADNNKYFSFFQGSDPGVSFISFFDSEKNINVTVVSNIGCNVWRLCAKILNYLNQ